MKTIQTSLTVLMLLTAAFANAMTLNGRVVDGKTNKGIGGVNIFQEDTNTGTASAVDGSFTLEVSSDRAAIICFQHIAYQMRKVKLPENNDAPWIVALYPAVIPASFRVVVTADRSARKKMDIARPSEIVTHESMTDKMASNLTDALERTPGFTQIWEYHSPLLLRGMNSKRLIVLLDGDRRVGTFPGGFMGQDMNIYGADKIEVIRGPGSVMYGSGAISGVINVIGADPFRYQGFNIRLHSGYGSNNNEILELVNLSWAGDNIAFSLDGKWRDTDYFYYGDDIKAENSRVEDKDVGINAVWHLSERQELGAVFNYHWGGPWEKPLGFNGPTKSFTEVENEEWRSHSALKYSFHSVGIFDEISLSVFYDHGRRDYYNYKHQQFSDGRLGKRNSLELVKYEDKYGGGHLFGHIKTGENNKVTLGADGYMFRLWSPKEIYNYYYNTFGTARQVEGAGVTTFGLFAQDEWKISGGLTVIAGLRFDAAEVLEGDHPVSGFSERNEQRSALSGNFGLVKKVSDHTRLSANIGRAFRMPTAEEMFSETTSCKGIKKGNPDLQPEYSWNIDLGWRGYVNGLEFDVALFANFLHDYINEVKVGTPPEDYFTFNNVKARITGAELSLIHQFKNVFGWIGKSLIPQIIVEYAYGEDVTGKDSYFDNGEALHGIPPLQLKTALRYAAYRTSGTFLYNYHAEISLDYATAQDRIPEVPDALRGPWGYVQSEAYTLFGCSAGISFYTMPFSPRLTVKVSNVLDKYYKPYGSYIPGMGRNIKMMLRLEM
jgi:hemoglobin/transferrin/lactoferrin receptor protein